MDDDDIFGLEERFWLGDAAFRAAQVDPGCLMAFAPAGILDAAALAQSLAAAPPWVGLDITGRRLARPDAALRVIGYTATARRDGGQVYRALCTSVYRRDAAGWRIVQHQQTPLPDGSANGGD